MKYYYRKPTNRLENPVYRREDRYFIIDYSDKGWMVSRDDLNDVIGSYKQIPDTLITILFNHVPEPTK